MRQWKFNLEEEIVDAIVNFRVDAVRLAELIKDYYGCENIEIRINTKENSLEVLSCSNGRVDSINDFYGITLEDE